MTNRKPPQKRSTGPKAAALSAHAKRDLFLAAYLADPKRNATAAAITAGYAPAGAAVMGTRLIREPKIAAAIEAARQEIIEKFDLSRDAIMQELASIAFANVHDLLDETGGYDHRRLTKTRAKAVRELEISDEIRLEGGDDENDPVPVTYRHTKIKMADKRAALVDLARITGLLRDDGPPAMNVVFQIVGHPAGPMRIGGSTPKEE